MKEIPLSQEQVALIDDDDFDRVSHYNWCAIKRAHTFYASRKIKNTKGNWSSQMLHIFIMGEPYIDHIDGNGLNNQKENLRKATPTQNRRNTRRRTIGYTSKYKGVYWNKNENKWRVAIYVNYKSKHLGYFLSELDAAKAYDKAAIELFSDFALTNKMMGLYNEHH